MKQKKTFLNFFSLNSQQLVGTYGRKGEGPGEISFLPTMVHHDFVNSGTFTYYDWGKKMLAEVPLQRALNNTDYSTRPQKNYVLPPELIKTQRLTYLNDSTIIGGGGNTKGKLLISNLEDTSFTYSAFIPESKQSIPRKNIGYAYFGFFSINKIQDKIVWANNKFPQFEIYNGSGDLTLTVDYSDAPKQEFNSSGLTKGKTVLFHKDIVTTQDSIYVLYIGKTHTELDRTNNNVNPEIRVFDWQGNPLKRIILDHYITKFDITADTIYGLAPYNKEGVIISFDRKN
jgi:hypothetical protein